MLLRRRLRGRQPARSRPRSRPRSRSRSRSRSNSRTRAPLRARPRPRSRSRSTSQTRRQRIASAANADAADDVASGRSGGAKKRAKDLVVDVPGGGSGTDEFEGLVLAEEACGSVVQTYRRATSTDDDGREVAVMQKQSARFGSLRTLFASCFLPEGYPQSVSEDYLEYQMWDTMQALCSSLSGTLSTQAMLRGYGVGNADASAVAATVVWLMRDGTGMLGRIFFAWFQGTNLDSNAKTWRIMADVTNDVGMLFELAAPISRPLFVPLMCLGSATKAITGVAGGATRAAVTLHQARHNNMADVAAKDGSQETAVNLVGMLLGLVLAPAVEGSASLVWGTFFLFVVLHLFANYRAVSCVVMSTINRQRAQILTGEFLARQPALSSPKQLARTKERIFWWPMFGDRGVDFGCSVAHASRGSIHRWERMVERHPAGQYLVHVHPTTGTVCVVLSQTAQPVDVLEAYFHAQILRRLQTTLHGADGGEDLSSAVHGFEDDAASWPGLCAAVGSAEYYAADEAEVEQTLDLVHAFVQAQFVDYYEAVVAAGWDVSHTQMAAMEWRAAWRDEHYQAH